MIQSKDCLSKFHSGAGFANKCLVPTREMTVEQGYDILINKFTIVDTAEAPDMLVSGGMTYYVSEAFKQYCEQKGYF